MFITYQMKSTLVIRLCRTRVAYMYIHMCTVRASVCYDKSTMPHSIKSVGLELMSSARDMESGRSCRRRLPRRSLSDLKMRRCEHFCLRVCDRSHMCVLATTAGRVANGFVSRRIVRLLWPVHMWGKFNSRSEEIYARSDNSI